MASVKNVTVNHVSKKVIREDLVFANFIQFKS